MKHVSLIRKGTALLLAVLTLLLPVFLTGCGDDIYEQEPSTKEEKAIVLQMGNHQVPYELFRTFFINRKAEVDQGDASVWTNEHADDYWSRIMPLVLNDIASVYTVFELCAKYDIDPYGEAVTDELNKQITYSVDGGALNGQQFTGYNGDYDAYLQDLKNNSHINDGAARTLIRYQICEDLLTDKLTSTYNDQNDYTEEDLRSFFESENCMYGVFLYREVVLLYLSQQENLDRVQTGVDKLRQNDDRLEVMKALGGYFNNPGDLETGAFYSPYAFNPLIYGQLLYEATQLSVGEYTDPIAITTANKDYYYVAGRFDKSEVSFEDNKKAIEDLYLRDRLYREMARAKEILLEQTTEMDVLKEYVGQNIVYPASTK